MLELFQGIDLLHKLRELVGGKEFLDPRLQRFGRNKLHRQGDIGVNGGHLVLDISLDLGHALPDIHLEEFSDKAHAATAQMVDVVFLGVGSRIQFCDMRNNGYQVFKCERPSIYILASELASEAAVEAVSAAAGVVVRLL